MATPKNNSLLKGIEILSLFSLRQTEISTALVVEQLGMNAATAHRFLMTLEHSGALRSVRRGAYVLGPRVEELASLVEATQSLAALLQPELDALSGLLNESVMACRPARHGPTCIAVAYSRRPIKVKIDVGTVLSLHNSAQGRLFLADMTPPERVEASAGLPKEEIAAERELDSIARRGYAVNLGQNEPDIGAVSVPVRNRSGRIALTLSVFGMLSRFDQDLMRVARTELFAAAERLTPKL